MAVWAFAMQKGGSGKSTLATQLATLAQQRGQRSLIIDLDPQRSAVVWSGLRAGKAPEAVPCLPQRLGEVLKHAQQSFGKTMIMVDTAPHSDAGAVEAMTLADVIIIPTKASVFDLNSMRDTVALLDHSGQRRRALVVVNDITPGRSAATAYQKAVEDLREFGLRICTTYICHRAAYINAVGEGSSVTEMKGRETAAAAAEIEQLWKEISMFEPVISKKEKA